MLKFSVLNISFTFYKIFTYLIIVNIRISIEIILNMLCF